MSKVIQLNPPKASRKQDEFIEVRKVRDGENLGNHLFDTEVDAGKLGQRAGVSVYVKDGEVKIRLLERSRQSAIMVPVAEILPLEKIGFLASDSQQPSEINPQLSVLTR